MNLTAKLNYLNFFFFDTSTKQQLRTRSFYFDTLTLYGTVQIPLSMLVMGHEKQSIGEHRAALSILETDSQMIF